MRLTVLLSLFVLALAMAQSARAQSAADPERASGFAEKPAAQARRHMVVAANPLAAQAGLEALRAGGTAVDAAIAAQAVLNVVEPQSSGFGGGAFALHWDAETGRLTSWDGRETAPLTATSKLFWISDPETGAERAMSWPEAVASGRSVGTPGLARLLWALHARHGARPWADLFGPAIVLAQDGFDISPRLAKMIAGARDRLAVDPGAAALFLTPEGLAREQGGLMRNPALADTLARLADRGPRALHTGPIAEEILAAVRRGEVPGALSAVDLAVYAAQERPPVCAVYRARFEVCGMGPPSSGGATTAQILGLLERFDLGAMAADGPVARHLFLEASKLAYADRDRYLADSDFTDVPLRGLLDADYLRARSSLIDPSRASEPREPGTPPGALARRLAADPVLQEGGTTHIVVVDDQGDIVSLTSSIETAFGSGRLAGGMLLNNQLTDFARTPVVDGAQVANRPGPGKRPRSSMAPTIVFDVSTGARRPILALGSPGGSRIIEYVAGALVAVLDHGAAVDAAVARPHVSQRNRGVSVVEALAAADPIAASLTAFGHEIERRDLTSGLAIVRLDADGGLNGAADPRREGAALGD